jgi:hypothetical protein
MWCKHFQSGIVPKCTAFPEGIPRLIFTNAMEHLSAHPEDNGLQFEAIPETPKEQLEFIRELWG